MKIILFVVFLTASFQVLAVGATQYLCVERESGGLKYSGGDWIGTGFNTADKWVARSTGEKAWEVLKFGRDEPYFTCKVGEYKKGQLACIGSYGSFRLNLETLKFVSTIDFGFDMVGFRRDSLSVGTGICGKM